MTCDQFQMLLSMYPDDMPDGEMKEAFLLHAASCRDCAVLLAEHEALLSSLSSLDDPPDGLDTFSSQWKEALRREPGGTGRKKNGGWKGALALVAASLALIIGGTALFGDWEPSVQTQMSQPTAAQNETAVYGGLPFATMDEAMEAPAADQSGEDRIVLQSAYVQLTSEAYEDTVASILALLAQREGWVEYQSVQGKAADADNTTGRTAFLQMRVPADVLHDFVAAVEGTGDVTESEIISEDISERYYDLQGRLDSIIAQRDRLNELLAQAQNIADIIEIESRLSEVQYTLESMTGRIAGWDEGSTHASVTLTVQEVLAPRDPSAQLSLGQRIQQTFQSSLRALQMFLKDALVILATVLPFLLCIAAVVLLIVIVYRVIQRKRKKENNS